jgi:predicted transcriptional regulator
MTSSSSETEKYKLSELLTEVLAILQTIKAWDKSDTELLKRLSYLINAILSETTQNQEDKLQNLIEAINERQLIDATIDYASTLARVLSEPDDPEDYIGDCRIP